MNDPHVVALVYRVERGEEVDYGNPAPLNLETPEFRLTVEDKEVRFEFEKHYATVVDARKDIEDYIRKWEFDACLEFDEPDYFRLKFDRSEIEDRNPPPPTLGTREVSGHMSGGLEGSSSGRVIRVANRYPSPPSNLNFDPHDPNTDTMFQRYMGYFQRREPLPSMAYLCLTVLENSAKPPCPQPERKTSKKRRAAAAKYQIAEDVLNEIGRLSTTKGGQMEGRKEEALTDDLTHEERRFLKHAIKKMIRRMAEKAHCPKKNLPEISLSNLPKT